MNESGGEFSHAVFASRRLVVSDSNTSIDEATSVLYFVSDRALLGESIFLRAAERLEMDFEFVQANLLLIGEARLRLSQADSIAVLDMASFPKVPGQNIQDLIEMVRPIQTIVALIERATTHSTKALIEAGFASVIDMSVSEGVLPMILKLSRSGQVFLPRFEFRNTAASPDFQSDMPDAFPSLERTLSEMGVKLPSEAEKDVLLELLRGSSNKEIATNIGRSVPTVKMHISRMCRRYGAANRVQLVLFFRSMAQIEQDHARGKAA